MGETPSSPIVPGSGNSTDESLSQNRLYDLLCAINDDNRNAYKITPRKERINLFLESNKEHWHQRFTDLPNTIEDPKIDKACRVLTKMYFALECYSESDSDMHVVESTVFVATYIAAIEPNDWMIPHDLIEVPLHGILTTIPSSLVRIFSGKKLPELAAAIRMMPENAASLAKIAPWTFRFVHYGGFDVKYILCNADLFQETNQHVHARMTFTTSEENQNPDRCTEQFHVIHRVYASLLLAVEADRNTLEFSTGEKGQLRARDDKEQHKQKTVRNLLHVIAAYVTHANDLDYKMIASFSAIYKCVWEENDAYLQSFFSNGTVRALARSGIPDDALTTIFKSEDPDISHYFVQNFILIARNSFLLGMAEIDEDSYSWDNLPEDVAAALKPHIALWAPALFPNSWGAITKDERLLQSQLSPRPLH